MSTKLIARNLVGSLHFLEENLKLIENLEKRAFIKTLLIKDLCSGDCERDHIELEEMINNAIQ